MIGVKKYTMVTPDKEELKKLKTAIDASFKDLQPFREASYETIAQYCGSHYGKRKDEDAKPVPVNFIQLATEIFAQHITPTKPRFNVIGKRLGLERPSELLSLALDHLSKELRLCSTMKEFVMNAMFSVGIVKTGTAAMDRGTVIDATMPFAECVSIKNFVYDTTADKWNRVTFAADRCYIDWNDFKKSGLYMNTDKVSKFGPHRDAYSDSDGFDSAKLSGAEDRTDEFKSVVEVWEVWLPGDQIIVTIPAQGDPVLLRVIPCMRENGPYTLLGFQDAPDNIMPVPPASTWRDIHEFANDVMIKIRNQSTRQKTILTYGKGGKDDANRVVTASDGQAIGVADPTQIKEIRFGGADQTNQAMLMISRDWFSWLGGNIDQLGGLSASADTLGQEQLIGASASKRLSKMKQAFMSAFEQIGEALADELWYDPMIDMPLVKEFPNSGIKLEMRFNEEEKEGDFLDYNIEVDPYSLNHVTPSEKLGQISQLMQQFILPLMPLMQQQGGSIDMNALMNLVAKYSDNPELNNVIVFQDSNPEENTPIQPEMGDKTTREYVRKNVATGGTRSFRDNELAKVIMGGATQPKSAEALGRMGA